ncbi:MAG TPA: hypothetical protein VIA06_03400 [Candidatus Dormibacteraeota bacterium]|nr:hypothetical protein [Candidatus Dormibacteraeota bacterium]
MRRLYIGEEVTGPEGSIGHLQRIVVDEKAHAITHLVVAGRVVGAAHFQAGEDGLRCDLDRSALERMPDVETASVAEAPPHWRAPGGYGLDNFLRVAEALIGQVPYVPPAQLEPDLSSVHELTRGSPVWHGGDQVGEVAAVLTDEADAITGIAVRHHLIDERMVGIEHVVEVIGNNVHIDLDQDGLRRQPIYES